MCMYYRLSCPLAGDDDDDDDGRGNSSRINHLLRWPMTHTRYQLSCSLPSLREEGFTYSSADMLHETKRTMCVCVHVYTHSIIRNGRTMRAINLVTIMVWFRHASVFVTLNQTFQPRSWTRLNTKHRIKPSWTNAVMHFKDKCILDWIELKRI